MEQTNDNAEVINVDRDVNPTTASKPAFPHLKKFMSNEYEDMRMHLNECVIATNVAYKYYASENKPTSPWMKLHTSLYHPTNGLFSCFKLPSNSKPLGNMHKKLFSGIYPEVKKYGDELIKNGQTVLPSIQEGIKTYDAYVAMLDEYNKTIEEEKELKVKHKHEMMTINSSFGVGLDSMGNTDKLHALTKYLKYSTNLKVNADPSTAASQLNNKDKGSPDTRKLHTVQYSVSSLNNYLSSISTKLLDLTGEDDVTDQTK